MDAVIVTTNHGGVYDSKEQEDASDPSFHNHYVRLTDDSDPCDEGDLRVEEITYESPGDIEIDGRQATLSDLQSRFTGTNIYQHLMKMWHS